MASNKFQMRTKLQHLPWGDIISIVIVIMVGIFWYTRYSYYRDLNASLISAVESGDVEGVRKALQAGANPNEIEDLCKNIYWDPCDTRNPVLLLVVFDHKGKEQIMRLLLEAGADVSLKNGAGYSALYLASDPDFTMPPNNRKIILEYAKKQGKLH